MRLVADINGDGEPDLTINSCLPTEFIDSAGGSSSSIISISQQLFKLQSLMIWRDVNPLSYQAGRTFNGCCWATSGWLFLCS